MLASLPWDIAVQRILPAIDNKSCVRKIAKDSDVSILRLLAKVLFDWELCEIINHPYTRWTFFA